RAGLPLNHQNRSSRLFAGTSRPPSSARRSVLVVLYDPRRADIGLVRVLAELALRPALAEQVPGLVELDVDLLQPRLLFVVKVALFVEGVLFLGELVDRPEDGLVGGVDSHDLSLSLRAPNHIGRAVDMREIVLDTETTGLDPSGGDRVVEIGCVELLNHIPSGRKFHRYVNPGRSMSIDAVRVHGLED